MAAQARSILSSLHAAMVNSRLYPPASDIVEDSMRRAWEEMLQYLSTWGGITFSEIEGKLLVNGFALDERYQSRPSTIAFLKDLALWGASSITFDDGLSGDELRVFMEILGRRRGSGAPEGRLGARLAARGVEHIGVGEKTYVPPSGERDAAAAPPGDEDALRLTERIVEGFERLQAQRGAMSPRDFEDALSALGETVSALYAGSEPRCHAQMTGRLRDAGLLGELARRRPETGREMRAYAVAAEIRASGSLRALEGLSEEEVVAVAGRLLDMGERGTASRIVSVTSRNLVSERPDFRLRACSFLKRIYLGLRERGHREEILDRLSGLPQLLLGEYNPGVRVALLDLLGSALNDLFTTGRRVAFIRACTALLEAAEAGGGEGVGRAAAEALASLDAWEVGRPLTDSLFTGDEELRKVAARVLPYMDEVLTAREVADRLKGEEDMEVNPELAAMCSSLEGGLLADISLVLEGNAREEVYFRTLDLLELLGGNAALALVRSVETNPIPAVRARALRTMSRMPPSDPALLPHLLKALGDEEPEVRRAAVRGLGGIGDPRSVEALLGIIRGKGPAGGEEHPRVEEAACLALAKLGPEEAVAPLSELLRKKVFSLRRRAADPRTKAAACYALGEVGGTEVVPLIRQYLDDPDPVLRNEARKAIASLRKRGYAE